MRKQQKNVIPFITSVIARSANILLFSSHAIVYSISSSVSHPLSPAHSILKLISTSFSFDSAHRPATSTHSFVLRSCSFFLQRQIYKIVSTYDVYCVVLAIFQSAKNVTIIFHSSISNAHFLISYTHRYLPSVAHTCFHSVHTHTNPFSTPILHTLADILIL